MRLRNIPNAQNYIDNEKKYYLSDPKKYVDFFNKKKPIYLEIGMGKGKFLIDNAIKNKNINYIGIEKEKNIVYLALKKVNELEIKLDNLKIIKSDASLLKDFFNKNTIDKIYLNFPDPWPKKRHTKRRLTFREFLNLYYDILKNDGQIELKTDQKNLYEFSKDEINNKTKLFKIIKSSIALNETTQNYVTTEYEEKFRKEGKNIYYLQLNKVK